MIFGGNVDGGKMYWSYSSLALNSLLDIGRGRIIPSTSSDLYFAELARCFGINNSTLDMVLPNIDRFFDVNSSEVPIGFMT